MKSKRLCQEFVKFYLENNSPAAVISIGTHRGLDSSPMDFFSCGCLKSKVYYNNPSSIVKLKKISSRSLNAEKSWEIFPFV